MVRPRAARFVIFALGAPLVSDFQQSTRHCTIQRFQPEMTTFWHFRTGRTTLKLFSAKCTSLCKTAFSARDEHVLSFLQWTHHFLAIFSKVHGFVEYSDSARREHVLLSPRCTGHTTLMRFSAKWASLRKNTISLRDEHVLSFLHRAHHFLAIFSNAHEFVQISLFNPRSTCSAIFALGAPLYSDFQQSARVCTKQRFLPKINVLPFSHWAYHFLAIFSKVHEFVQNSCFIPRSECFAISALSVPLFSDFQQSERVCTNQRFQPDISMFCHFRTRRTTL